MHPRTVNAAGSPSVPVAMMYFHTCALTGVALPKGAPVVSLLVTGRAGLLAADRTCHPCGVWSPRTVPMFGTVGDAGMVDFDASDVTAHLPDLWREGLSIDMIPRAGTPLHRALRRTDLLRLLLGVTVEQTSYFASRLRVRPLGACVTRPKGEPTIARVRRVMAARGLETTGTVVSAPVWPFVFVDWIGDRESSARAWVRQMSRAADDNCWAVTHVHVDGWTARVHLAPSAITDATMARAVPHREHAAPAARRPPHPVGLCVVHRTAWEKACALGEAGSYEGLMRVLSLREAAVMEAGPIEARRDVRRALGLLAGFDRSRAVHQHELLDDVSRAAPGTIGLLWSLGRALQRVADYRRVQRGIGEVLAVTETLRNAGLAWAPSRCIDTGHDREGTLARELAEVTRAVDDQCRRLGTA